MIRRKVKAKKKEREFSIHCFSLQLQHLERKREKDERRGNYSGKRVTFFTLLFQFFINSYLEYFSYYIFKNIYLSITSNS